MVSNSQAVLIKQLENFGPENVFFIIVKICQECVVSVSFNFYFLNLEQRYSDELERLDSTIIEIYFAL